MACILTGQIYKRENFKFMTSQEKTTADVSRPLLILWFLTYFLTLNIYKRDSSFNGSNKFNVTFFYSENFHFSDRKAGLSHVDAWRNTILSPFNAFGLGTYLIKHSKYNRVRICTWFAKQSKWIRYGLSKGNVIHLMHVYKFIINIVFVSS